MGVLFLFEKIKLKHYFRCVQKKVYIFNEPTTNLLDSLKNYLKCLKYSQTFYTHYSQTINEFNELINKTNELKSFCSNYLLNFSKDNFLSNPYALNDETRKLYFDSCKFLKQFKNVKPSLLEKSDNFIFLIKNFSTISQQYIFNNKYLELINNLYDKYITSKEQNFLINLYSSIKKSLKREYLNFYNIPLTIDLNCLINNKNNQFIERHIKDKVFDNVNGKSLDDEQRKAILKDDNSALTIAGAGSGKTLTICGKIKYLLECKNVKPEDILILSYSKKSVDDLNTKIKTINENLNAYTFHKLGLDLIIDNDGIKQTIEEQSDAIVEKYFREELAHNDKAKRKILEYMSMFMLSNVDNKDCESTGDYYNKLKQMDFKTLKSTLIDYSCDKEKKQTIKKENVKSFEELALANFYFLNGINYEYETPYKWNSATRKKRQYLPDFYLTDYGIYHEHYGIDKDGKAHQYDDATNAEYEATMYWKRTVHKQYHTTCIESYSYEFKDGNVFENLEANLKKYGVEFKPLSSEEINKCLDSIYESHNFKSFINLVRSFINLYKAKYDSEIYFDQLANSNFNFVFEKIRATQFLNIAKDVYIYYKNILKTQNKIDFDDMILKGAKEAQKLKDLNYNYIIIDEFQDISYSRMIFLKELLNKSGAKLFAVGDDWQSIYRFSGCDVSIFLNFKEYFGESTFNVITSCHRNSQELENIASKFILSNPDQYKKVIKSEISLNNPIKIQYFLNEKYSAFAEVLESIYKKDNNAEILLLGRNNFDIEELLCQEFNVKNKDNGFLNLHYKKYPSLKIKFCTVHASKGLESDYVVIINADNNRHGFPNKLEDDEILNLVLSNKGDFAYAEERRLWYVALTRTRTFTYILSPNENKSLFVKEIEDMCSKIYTFSEENVEKPLLCPQCKAGKLVIRESHGKKFYGCTNYPYCNYTNSHVNEINNSEKCPICGDFLFTYNGKYGSFKKCHNPKCTYNIRNKYRKYGNFF